MRRQGITELPDRRGACWPVRCLVHATRQTDRGDLRCEDIDTVDQDARRAMEPDPQRVGIGVDEPVSDVQVEKLAGERIEVFGGLLPVRAAVEIQQGDVHDPTINLLL